MNDPSVIAWLQQVDTGIWQAVIAGGIVAIGWAVNGWQNRRVAARLRKEKLRDYHRAIYAEIGANLANLWDVESLENHRDAILARMAGDPSFVPFIPIERQDAVFDAFIGEIHILPRQTIDPIVVYYAQVKSIAALALDMRSDRFASMPPDSRRAMYEDYIDMKIQLLAFGQYANALISAYSEGSTLGAQRAAQRLSSQGADLSDR
ncbi:MAG: hypothetical protein AAF755_12810 [Pseudomonadota bacterium]